MEPNQLFEHLIAKKPLTPAQMEAILEACMRGQWSETQMAVFLALMRAKGETVEELTAAARTILQHAPLVPLGDAVIDIVGTGGDGLNTFNVSTASSIVAAACGAKVAKQGASAVSSRSGSADLLALAGVPLEATPEQLQACLARCNLCFLFAPHFHKALLEVRTARTALGIRSFFNLLGPLINPARPRQQLVGVFSAHWLKPVAEVLVNLGSTRVLVVHSRDGLDECSIAAVTDVVEYHNQQFSSWTLDPEDYGLYHGSLKAIEVDSPAHSLQVIEAVLQGALGPARDITVLNAACALYCANVVTNIASGVAMAQQALDTGRAGLCFERLRTFSPESPV